MSRDRGFTLVEATVAVAVASILAGVVVPLVLKTLTDARIARARRDLDGIAEALVAQMRDTGGRPMAAGGPGGGTGEGAAFWFSSPRLPRFGAVGDGAVRGPLAANRFVNLFCSPDWRAGSQMFGLGGGAPTDRFRLRGPYLSDASANQSDPWGNAYLVLGYNARGQAGNGPIWVVSAGPEGTLEGRNVGGFGFMEGRALPREWDYTGLSEGNLAVRVH